MLSECPSVHLFDQVSSLKKVTGAKKTKFSIIEPQMTLWCHLTGVLLFRPAHPRCILVLFQDVCKLAFVSLYHSWLPSYDDQVGDDSTEVKYKSECNSCQRWSTLRQCQRWSTPPALQFAKVRPMLVTKSHRSPITLNIFKPSFFLQISITIHYRQYLCKKGYRLRVPLRYMTPEKNLPRGLKWCFAAKKIVQIRGVPFPSLPTKIYGFEWNIE